MKTFVVTCTTPTYCQITDGLIGSRTVDEAYQSTLATAVAYLEDVCDMFDEEWDGPLFRIALKDYSKPQGQRYNYFDWTHVDSRYTGPIVDPWDGNAPPF